MDQISLRSLSRLRPWPKNYWVGDVPAIAASIRRFGFNGCLCVKGQMVVAGNHTLLALKSLRDEGIDPPRGIKVRGREWMVACVNVSHLSDAEAVAFAIAHNHIHDLGHANTADLAQLLQELSQSDATAFAATAFTANDVEALLKAVEKASPPAAFAEPDAQTQFRCPECGFEWAGAQS